MRTKNLLYTGLVVLLFGASACSNKYDDLPEPQETLKGSVTDVATGTGVQTEAGSNGTRVKLEELSYNSSPTPTYFVSFQDGTFNNTKIYKGHYRVSVEGPFVPLVQTDANGEVTVDNRKETDIAGETTLDFKVEPFLTVDWVGEPVYNSADSSITVQVKINRGTSNPDFQQNISDVNFYVNYLPYVGNNYRVDRYCSFNAYSSGATSGDVITLKSNDKLALHRDYYLRVGARIDYGQKYYNYTVVKKITIP